MYGKTLYKDFDGIGDYFKRYVLRPLRNLQLGTTERDKEFIALSVKHNVDFIAHSFVRNGDDVRAVQEILDELNSKIKREPRICLTHDGRYGVFL